ncbi:hypothetical protein RCH20_000260 [Psychrobacter sp. PL15]|uniref:type IV pilus assembly protein FimV n=1 Tax=Psychrobacter sp. PL15 TaxID=3071719 RepID=UPI002E0789C7|nr:hypothetical protein [Psychrobacter sp. PL15]
MSWELPHRLTTVHRAVSITLLCSVSSVVISIAAQAATIGKTRVMSAQYEPLAANIIINNIEASYFSASLANTVVYQQMGLTPTDSITVRFQLTSSNTGLLLISTTQPISEPFVDIVLTINDGGQRKVIPKTLLMPLNDNLSIQTDNTLITGAQRPSLAVSSVNSAKPLTIRPGAPPLLISPKWSMPNVQTSSQAQTLILSTAVMPTLPINNLTNAPNTTTIDLSTPSIYLNNSTPVAGITDK